MTTESKSTRAPRGRASPRFLPVALLALTLCPFTIAYELSPHPRIFVNKAALEDLAERARGPLAREYGLIKQEADRALAEGPRTPSSRYQAPVDQICLAISRAETMSARGWSSGEVRSRSGSRAGGRWPLASGWGTRRTRSWASRSVSSRQATGGYS